MEALFISTMTENTPPKRNVNIKDLPRSFMSPAYVEEIDTGVFAMYRDIMIETNQVGEDGKRLREKFGKRIGPVMMLREATKTEDPDFTTSRSTGEVLMLKKIEKEQK